ncbi:hypothetical protein [Sporolactobacillus pectinivorans]|nr:hypothetical protein [Sporolactobacillus pectinivorans]
MKYHMAPKIISLMDRAFSEAKTTKFLNEAICLCILYGYPI